MLMTFLVLLFLGTLVLIVVRRRQVGRLTSFATLIAAIIVMIWMQDTGLLPGSPRPVDPVSRTVPAQ